jgi:hypothetical protein
MAAKTSIIIHFAATVAAERVHGCRSDVAIDPTRVPVHGSSEDDHAVRALETRGDRTNRTGCDRRGQFSRSNRRLTTRVKMEPNR